MRQLLTDELGNLLSIEMQIAQEFPAIQKCVHTVELAAVIKERTSSAKRSAKEIKIFVKKLVDQRTVLPEAVIEAVLVALSSIAKRYPMGNLRDAAFLTALQRLEHYRAAAFSSTQALAVQLGEHQILQLLQDCATQGELVAKRLGQIASQVNAEAFLDTESESCTPVSTI